MKPIALYNSNIWSAYKPFLRGKTVDEMFESTLKNTNEFDRTYKRCSKQILGVYSKVCKFAVISEQGQFPLIVSILANCISFCYIPFSITQILYYRKHIGLHIWLQFVKSFFFDLRFSHVWNNQSTFNVSALLFFG